jgi:hypothetical protein
MRVLLVAARNGHLSGAGRISLLSLSRFTCSGGPVCRKHVTDEGHPGQRRLAIQFQRLADNTTIVGLVGDLRGQSAWDLPAALAEGLIGSP